MKKYKAILIYTNHEHLPKTVTLDTNFTIESVIQCNVPFVENDLLDNCE